MAVSKAFMISYARLYRRAFFSFAVLIATFPSLAAASGELGLREMVEHTNLKGGVVGLHEMGEAPAIHPFGTAAPDEPVTDQTLFRAGSLSKLIVSLLALRAVEAGVLHLDTELVKILPEVVSGPGVERLTLAHLLEHTSGLRGSTYADYAADEPGALPEEVIRARAPFRLRWKPGLHYSYSNPGYTLAGRMIEVAWGRPFDQLIKEEVLLPLGMTGSHFQGPDDDPVDLPSFTAEGARIQAPWHMPDRPAGALVTNGEDMSKLLAMLIARGKLPSGDRFLRASSIGRMERGVTGIAGRHGLETGAYGLGNFGFVANGRLLRGHWGRTEGFQTTLGYLPGEAGFFILTNTADRAGMHKLRETVAMLFPEAATPQTDSKTKSQIPALPGLFVGATHDMPVRSRLFGLLEARLIEPSTNGLRITPIWSGQTSEWMATGANQYRASGIPVASGTFKEIDGRWFWVDGESARKTHTILFWTEIALLACAAAAAVVLPILWMVTFLLPWQKLRHRRAIIGVAAAGALALAGVVVGFLYAGLLAPWSVMRTVGTVSLLSLSLLAGSLISPAAAVAGMLMVWRRRDLPGLLLMLPFLLGLAYFTWLGWIPLIPWHT